MERRQGRHAKRDRDRTPAGRGERGGHEEHTRQERDQPGRAVDGSANSEPSASKREKSGGTSLQVLRRARRRPPFEQVLGDPRVLAPVPFQHRAVMDPSTLAARPPHQIIRGESWWTGDLTQPPGSSLECRGRSAGHGHPRPDESRRGRSWVRSTRGTNAHPVDDDESREVSYDLRSPWRRST